MEQVDLSSGAASRVFVDVRSKGLVSALDHELTFAASPDSFALRGVDASGAIDVDVVVRVPVARFDPPEHASRFDRDKMTDNLRGKEVLDMARWPALVFRGRYSGTIVDGRLAGDLEVRGAPRPIALDVVVTRASDVLHVEGVWEGTLGDLGIKPYKALFGALKLADWIRIRIAISLTRV